MIAALGEKTRVIGKNNRLLWKIPEDLKRFKAITSGHAVIMGRKTFESIGRPLPNRTNIVITMNPGFEAPGCIISPSLESALEEAGKIEPSEIFILGGGEIYRQALPYADRLYLFVLYDDAEGDAFFPDFSDFQKVISREERTEDGLGYAFLNLEK